MSNDPKDAVVDLSKLMKGWQDSNSSEAQVQASSATSDNYLITICNESAGTLMGYETFAEKRAIKKKKVNNEFKILFCFLSTLYNCTHKKPGCG